MSDIIAGLAGSVAAPVLAKDVAPAPVESVNVFAKRMVGRLETSFFVARFVGGGLGVGVQTSSGKSAPWVALASLTDPEKAALAEALGL